MSQRFINNVDKLSREVTFDLSIEGINEKLMSCLCEPARNVNYCNHCTQNVVWKLQNDKKGGNHTGSGGVKNEKHNRWRKLSKKPFSCSVALHLLALNAAGDHAVGAVSVAVFHVGPVRHVDLLRRVADQLDGLSDSVVDLASEAALAQQRIDGLDLIPA